VLNPAAVLHDGLIYLFYRAVALHPANYSRILIATCMPQGIQFNFTRLDQVALEPQEPYELWANGQGGGVEDPRITRLEQQYYMTYTAYGTHEGQTAPRIALAQSQDLFHWQRLGLLDFSPLTIAAAAGPTTYDLNALPNKDAVLFPEKVNGRYVLLHRPMFEPETGIAQSIWLSWSSDLVHWSDHQLVLAPVFAWERLKVGAGTQPLRIKDGWLLFYHGVEGSSDGDPNRRYHAGVLILAHDDPAQIVYHSPQPVLSPQLLEETNGVVNNVVFPCAAVVLPVGQILVFYGMGDRAIGLATTRLPEELAAP
jgi:predicted GH43/DUF377 family glycosyl hydrolase